MYSMPGQREVTLCGNGIATTGSLRPGFHIAPFSTLSHQSVTIAPESHSDIHVCDVESLLNVSAPLQDVINAIRSGIPTGHPILNAVSTTKDTHLHAVEEIKRRLSAIKSETGIRGKVVTTRMECQSPIEDPISIFVQLRNKYLNAFIFMFHSPITGMWIGASPEMLLCSSGSSLTTMALAGTRPSGSSQLWDSKNIEEQQIVTDYIINTLRDAKLSPYAGSVTTRAAGPVEHLCTQISAPLPSGFNVASLENILSKLSPTPALGGFPRREAASAIAEVEDFDREYYGGYCGPHSEMEDFSFFVNLRCAKIGTEGVVMFAGGGITLESNPQSEWEETERKLSTLKSIFYQKNF